MHVIWRRPDGFHNSHPNDYILQTVAKNSNLWLHKKDRDFYPFRISGGWQDEDATKELNQLVNLLRGSYADWLKWFKVCYFESPKDNFNDYIKDRTLWLESLLDCLSGDKWEIQITYNQWESKKWFT